MSPSPDLIELKPHNRGSEKHPLALIVTTEARQQEVQTPVDEAQLHTQISVDTSEDGEESIAELTALFNKGATVKLDKTPA